MTTIGAAHDAVRKLHDDVARSGDDVVASTRPAGTTATEMAAMVADVLAKLGDFRGRSVVELGCGTGVLGLPVARLAGSYVGVDLSAVAVEVFRERLAEADLSSRAHVLCLDVVAAEGGDFAGIAPADRVLAYAMLHYLRDEEELLCFLRRAIGLLSAGGELVIGNIPVAEHLLPTGAGRVARGLHWVLSSHPDLPGARLWKVRSVLWQVTKRGRSTNSARTDTAELPAGNCVVLSRAMIERCLERTGVRTTWRWALPAVGIPLHRTRLDLIVKRD
jgi:SAM-dependent methyltransferase